MSRPVNVNGEPLYTPSEMAESYQSFTVPSDFMDAALTYAADVLGLGDLSLNEMTDVLRQYRVSLEGGS